MVLVVVVIDVTLVKEVREVSRHFPPDRGSQLPLFEVDGWSQVTVLLNGRTWPELTRVPVNRRRAHVRYLDVL